MPTDLESFQDWLNDNMMQGKRDVPARLATLVGLLERLRTTPALDMDAHRAPSGMQLIEHNSAVDTALQRFNIGSPLQERGRRSNNLNAWAPPMFDWLRASGFPALSQQDREITITALQTVVVERLSVIIDDKPLLVRYNLGTAVAIITDILDQAQVKNKAKDVAEYLVGAKLEIRFHEGVVPPKNVNTPSLGNLADFRIGNTAIEVTVLKNPDKSHLDQIGEILADTGLQVWLLTRMLDRERWQNAIDLTFARNAGRVVVAGIEIFLGQNISELGEFKIADVRAVLSKLFARYADVWLPTAGSRGLRIVDPEDEQEQR
jgi:hypothetical protein